MTLRAAIAETLREGTKVAPAIMGAAVLGEVRVLDHHIPPLAGNDLA